MAVRIVNLGSGGTQDALLKQLIEQYGRQTTPKVGGLQRILAPLTGIGSAIDAYHDARYEDKDPGVLNVLKNYGQNIAQGFGTLASGTSYEDIQGASALMDKLDPSYKNSAIGGSAVGRIGVDIAAGLLTDPTTYFGFGAASLADDAIKGGLKAAGLSTKGVKKLLPKLSGSTLTGANKILVKELGADVADKFYVNIMQNVGKSTTKSGALKLLGKTVSESKPVVKGAKALISPLGGAMDALDWGSKKFTPGLRASALSVFDPVQGLVEQGKGQDAVDLLKFNRESSSLYMGILGELRDAGLLESFNKVGADEKATMAKLIEASKETAFTSFQADEIIKRKKEVLAALKEYIGTDVKPIGDIFPEGLFGDKTGMSSVDMVFNPDEYGYLAGKKVPIKEYMEKAKGKSFKTVLMSPDEYLNQAYKSTSLDGSVEKYIEAKTSDKETIDYLLSLLKTDTKMDMPWLEYKAGDVFGQEGAHRAIAAKKLGLREIPVTIEYSTKRPPSILKKLQEYIPQATEFPQSVTTKMDAIYETLSDEQKPLLDALISGIGGEKLTSSQLSKLFDEKIGNYTDKTGQLLSIPEGVSTEGKDFLSKYFTFERGKLKRMKELGLPVLDPKEMGYISRMPVGYKEKILKSTLKKAGMQDTYEKVMGNKSIKKDLEKYGYVKRETLQKVMNENELGAFKKYDPGTLGELRSGKGADKARKFLTREQAEAAGIVYGDNPMEEIYNQSVRQEEQILAASFAEDMVRNDKSFSKKPRGVMTTPVTIPGMGTYYTDKYMAKVAEDYLQRYTTVEGIDKLLTGFDKAQRVWKKWVTGLGPNAPAYHLRNFIDDMIRVVVDGADVTKLPNDYALAIDIFQYEELLNSMGKEEALKQVDQSRAAKFFKEVGIETENPLDELWHRAIKNGVYSDTSKSVSEMHMGMPREAVKALGMDQGESKIERLAQNTEDVVTIGGKLPKREQATRMATYFNNWRKEGVESAGVESVGRVNFNYNELTKPEREVFRRVVPFYGFVKNNIRFYMDLLKDNPEKLARYYNVYEGIQSGSQSKYGEDWEAMPDYVKDTLSVPFGDVKDGKLKYLSGLNLGIEGLNDLPIGEEGLRNAAGNLSPELGMLIELTTGKDLFRGEDIVEGNQGYNYENRSELLKKLMNYQKYPVQLKDGREYEKQTVSPMMRYYMESTPFVSTLNTLLKRAVGSGDKSRAEDLTNIVLPGRINIGRIDDAKERIKRKQEEDLYKLLQKKGLADVYRSFYIPEGLREQLLK